MSLTSALLRLAVVAIIFAGAMYLLRRTAGRSRGAGQRPTLRVTSKVQVARGSNLLVVDFGSQTLLAGAGQGGVRLLGTLDTVHGPDHEPQSESGPTSPQSSPATRPAARPAGRGEHAGGGAPLTTSLASALSGAMGHRRTRAYHPRHAAGRPPATSAGQAGPGTVPAFALALAAASGPTPGGTVQPTAPHHTPQEG